eukprot:UN09903
MLFLSLLEGKVFELHKWQIAQNAAFFMENAAMLSNQHI